MSRTTTLYRRRWARRGRGLADFTLGFLVTTVEHLVLVMIRAYGYLARQIGKAVQSYRARGNCGAVSDAIPVSTSSTTMPSEKIDTEQDAIEVLVSLGPKAVPILRKLLTHSQHGDTAHGPVWTITPIVAQMLVEIGPPSIPALIDALNDEQTHVYPFVAQALHTLTGQNFGTDYEKWRDWWLSSQAGEHMPVVEGKPEDQ